MAGEKIMIMDESDEEGRLKVGQLGRSTQRDKQSKRRDLGRLHNLTVGVSSWPPTIAAFRLQTTDDIALNRQMVVETNECCQASVWLRTLWTTPRRRTGKRCLLCQPASGLSR